MIIYDVTKPGSFIIGPDEEWMIEVRDIISGLENSFYDATVCLHLFNESKSLVRWVSTTDRERSEYYEASNKFAKELEQKYRSEGKEIDHAEIYFQSSVLAKKEQWGKGNLPRALQHNQPKIHARSFLYSLDMFGKFLQTLFEFLKPHKGIEDAYNEFKNAFPTIIKIRNTIQHMDERSRGLGRGFRGNPPPQLPLREVRNPMISYEGGFDPQRSPRIIITDSLRGDTFGCTIDDGTYQEIDINDASMKTLQKILQKVFLSFHWDGGKSNIPY
ncbi:Uncharacterised protein [Klebsiella pneumoniae]|nr:Uncharacterised protein [Klebsiella pneumoniae]SXU56474.1 Uncharacterised protein [Klebsiella pneumoniae]VUI48405.1 Uncharacterised protein [Klebsiella pneumoniae]